MDPNRAERIHAETVAEWRAWLERHHEREIGVWLVSWKTSTGRPRMAYEESVEEALAFGWVDSKANTVDAERSMLWFAPRRPGSGWSRPNKERIERLERDGRMTDAGRRVIERAKSDGSWTLLDDVENLVVPDDLAAAFAAHPGSRDQWEAFPRSARRGILEWIVQAKTGATRERRISQTAEAASRGERANQWRPKDQSGKG
jgi:uncharacterized protein YdeI (YjbR/CyaY-like superfamily)